MLHHALRLSRSRRSRAIIISAVVVIVGLALSMGFWARRVSAQPGPSAIAYVYLRGVVDTIGVETVSRTATAVQGILSMKGQPRVEWQHAQQNGVLGALTLRVFAPSAATETSPLQSGTVDVRGDSAYVDLTSATQNLRQAYATKAGALPLVNASVLHSALLAARARAIQSSVLNVFLTSGAQTLSAAISQSGDTTTFKLAASDMRIVLAPDGFPSVILLPGQNVRVMRATTPVGASAGRINYDAPPGAPFVAEHVRIPSGRGYDLAATLTKPRGVPKMPVVITISGSGPQERDSRISVVPGYEIFRQIADTLGRRGIAVLRYDDRGVGESGGRESAAKGTSADFADDVRSIVTWLRARADVDGARIALVGHSEGGMIAPMVAVADPTIKAVALLAGPAYDGRKILMFQNRQSIDNAPGLNAMQRDSIWKTVPAALDSLARVNPWMGFFMSHDPLRTARQMRQPVLVLQGATDRQITPEQADSVVAALRGGGNRDVTLRIVATTNHLFLIDPSGLPGGYASLKDPKVNREALGAVADWMSRVLR